MSERARPRIFGFLRRRRGKRRARSRRERRGFRFTREGKVFLGVTFGVGIAAINTGNNLLYLVLGLMLSTLLLSGVLSELALRRVRVRRRLPARAFARTPFVVEVELANDKRWLPSFSLEVEDRAIGAPTDRRCYFLKVAAGAQQTASYRRTSPRRGILKLTGYRLATRYPFGLIEKVRQIPDPAERLVFPELLAVNAPPTVVARQGAEVSSRAPGAGQEVGGVRDYRREDEARDIHWRRTASLGRLVVRERERDALMRVSIVLDNARPEPDDPEWEPELERAISQAAWLASDALAKGAAVDVRVRGGGSPLVLPGSPPEPIWQFLALLEPLPHRDAPGLPWPRGATQVIRLSPRQPLRSRDGRSRGTGHAAPPSAGPASEPSA